MSVFLLAAALASFHGRPSPQARPVGRPSAFWARHGLVVRVVDSVAHLDSVGGFALEPGLEFSAKGLEDARGAAVAAFRPDIDDEEEPDPEQLYCALVWGQGAIVVLAPYDSASLDPRSGTLHLGGVFLARGARDASGSGTTARPPQTLQWRDGRWASPVSFPAGATLHAFPVRIGRQLGILRTGTLDLEGDAWDLGEGPHLVQWAEDGARNRTDTLRGRLLLRAASGSTRPAPLEDSLEEPPSRIIAFGGAAFGRRGNEQRLRDAMVDLRISEMARGIELAGNGVWASRWGGKGRFDATKGLRSDTARLPEARVVDAGVTPSGEVVSGTLLDTLPTPLDGGELIAAPGARIVRGLPALGGPGQRWVEVDLGAYGLHPAGAPGKPSRFAVAAPGTWARTAILQEGVALRWGAVDVVGRLALVRQEDARMDGGSSKDRFRLAMRDAAVKIRGLADTAGAPAETVADSIGQDLSGPPTYWSLDTPGPWRQMRDPVRPWISYRFRPRLGFADRSFVVSAESLKVSWQGGAFAPAPPGRGCSVDDSGLHPRDREAAPLVFPAPPEARQPDPWPGLGRFHMDSVRVGTGTTLWLSGQLVPAVAWERGLGSDSIPARLAATMEADANGRWSLRVPPRARLEILPRDRQFLTPLGGRLLLEEDTLTLASQADHLAFSRTWTDPVLEGPVVLGRPGSDNAPALLRAIAWTGDSTGAPVSWREEWELLVRPREYRLPDQSLVRGRAPLAVRLVSTARGIDSVRLVAPAATWMRAGKTFRSASDSVLTLGPDGLPVDAVLAGGKAPAPLPPVGGRVSIRLGKRSLRVDRAEVSWKDWDRCVEDGTCRPIPLDSCGNWMGSSRHADSVRARRFDAWRALPDMPATCVLPSEAEAYCSWAHGRLPTHKEYHLLAARVVDSLRARRGESWPMNTWWNSDWKWEPDGEDPFPDMAPPGSLRPVPPGLYELGGNAEELCTDKELGNDEDGGIRFHCVETSGWASPEARKHRPERVGFRCVE